LVYSNFSFNTIDVNLTWIMQNNIL